VVLLRDLGKRKAKLDPPPRDNPRGRESYLVLRELLLAEAAARKAFLTVAWKGRPSGPVLLSQLLSKGHWVPEVDTDSDYLEAELDHIEEALADSKHQEGQWTLGHGWTVVREVAKAQQRSSNTRFKVAFRASGVVLRHNRRVRLAGSAMIRVASVSTAGNVRCRWMPVPKGSWRCASDRTGTRRRGISAATSGSRRSNSPRAR